MDKTPQTGQFRGIYSIPVTPFKSDHSLDEASLKRCIEFILKAGAHGLVAPVNASEYFVLSDEERRTVMKIAVETTAGRVPVVLNCTGICIPHAVAFAKYAEEIGADALIAMPPSSKKAPLPEIYDYYKAINEAVETPIFIQNYEGMGGTAMPGQFLGRLVRELPNVEYIKEETFPPPHAVSRALDAAGEHTKGVMGGLSGRYLLNEYRRGGCGTMPAGHVTEVHVKLWDLLESGKEGEARALYNRLLPLMNFEALFGIRCYKEVFCRRGIIDSPLMRISTKEHMDEHDHKELDAILEGMADLLTCSLGNV